jgi:hypothetical protein
MVPTPRGNSIGAVVRKSFATTFPFFASPLGDCANQEETAMAKLIGCRICMVDFARIELADGTVALVCSACDVVGVEHEVTRGGPLWAEASRATRRAVKR